MTAFTIRNYSDFRAIRVNRDIIKHAHLEYLSGLKPSNCESLLGMYRFIVENHYDEDKFAEEKRILETIFK